MAVTFTSNAACLNVQNGAAVLTGERGTGTFAVNCEVNTKFNSLGLMLYPNPVSATTKVKFLNIPPLKDNFFITIWSSQGEKLSITNATGYEIYQGKLMNMGSLISGSYIIQIECSHDIELERIVKFLVEFHESASIHCESVHEIIVLHREVRHFKYGLDCIKGELKRGHLVGM
jgi:hypothetical protein